MRVVRVSQLVQLRSMARDILHNNTGIFRPYQETSQANNAPKTARQVVAEESREARFEKNQATFYYVQWEMWHKETFRRLTNPEYINSELDLPGLKEARTFLRRCMDRGVPPAVLLAPDMISIRVSKAIGLGSVGVKMDVTAQLLQARGSMDETGRRYAEREWAAALVGYGNVDKFFPLKNRDEIPSNDKSIATLENNDFMEGSTVPAGSDQRHALHLVVHIKPLTDMATMFEQDPNSVDAVKMFSFFQIALPHVKEHVGYMSQDLTRAPLVKEYLGLIKMLERSFNRVANVVRRMQAEQQAQQQDQQALVENAGQIAQDRESAVKIHEIDKKYQLEMMKQTSLNQARAQKTEEQMRIKQMQTMSEINRKAEEMIANLEMKAKELDAHIALLKAKSSSEPKKE